MKEVTGYNNKTP